MTVYERLQHLLTAERGVAVATVVAAPNGLGAKLLCAAGEAPEGSLESPELDSLVAADAVRLLQAETPDTVSYALADGQYDVFIDVYPAPRKVVIVGASHIAIPLSHFARALGYRVIVVDARGAFAVPERFPDAHQVIKGWPQDVLPTLGLDGSTYLVLLTHDAKFDEPTLDIALPSPVPYIGAIGSRRTQRERFERLRARGYSDMQLARVYGPVGLDLGGNTVEETALAIMGEITAVRHGKDGGLLRRRLLEPATT